MFIERFETRHFRTHKPVLDTLKKEKLIFLDRTTNSDPRRGRADAVELAFAPARSRQDAEKQVTKIITSRARLDRRHGASELPKLRRIRIRMYLDRVDRFERQLNCGRACNRIRNIQARNKNATLAGPSAFDVQIAVRTTNNAGQ